VAICAIIVVTAILVANAKAMAISTNIFSMEIPPFSKTSSSKGRHGEYSDVILKEEYV
jgi:hypothetical protein